MIPFLIILAILVVCAAGVALYFLYTSRASAFKGKYGEHVVAGILGATIPGEQYIINDLLFKTTNGSSCQIDHIFINKHGIWVIETKNYSGMIYGSQDAQEWTQVLAYGKTKNRFYNPVKQNNTHIYHLSEQLHNKAVFCNVVCFLDNADISHVNAEHVYSVKELSRIKTATTNITLTEKQMEFFYQKLLSLQAKSEVSAEEHIDNIHEMQDKIARGICPRCGAKLVLRTGKSGQFYGCTSYPNCTFTKKAP